MTQDTEQREAEMFPVDEEAMSRPLPWETGKRFYPRWYFHDPEIPFEEQTSGIAGEVRRSGVLYDPFIGRIVIKDMSLGGIGFIAPSRYNLPRRVVVVVGKTYPLMCEILHRHPVSPSLTFYGASWYRMDRHMLMMAISRYARLCRLVS